MRIFDEPGPQNTEECLELAAARAREQGITEAVVATNTGDTAFKALKHLSGMKLIAVNHHAGFSDKGQDCAEPKVRLSRKKLRIFLLTPNHRLG